MVPFDLKLLAKFGHCTNFLQQLDECSLAKFLSLLACSNSRKFPYGKPKETLGKASRAMNVSGNMFLALTFY